MKKAFLLLIAIILSIVVLASCAESKSHGSLRIILETDPRSIVPENFPLEVAKYHITGQGPSGAEINLTTNNTSTTVDGLIFGDWLIEVTGLNGNGDELVYGSNSVRITGRTTNVTVSLDQLIGSGDITLNLSWNTDALTAEPTISVSLEPAYGEDVVKQLEQVSFNATEGKAIYKGEDYPSGSYLLSAKLYDNGNLIAGFTEAVRVAGDQESVGDIEFDLNKGPTEDPSFEIENTTGVPVTLTIEGLADTVTADNLRQVTLVSDSDDIDSFRISWHLNGEKIGEGQTLEFYPSVGIHRLDAVASTSRTGSMGSATFNFEAIENSDIGEPNQGNVIYEANSGIKMGMNMVVEFLPNGEVIIASNEDRVLQICSISRSSLKLEKTFEYDDLDISEEQTISAIAAGEKQTNEHLLFVLFEGPLNAAVYRHSALDDSLTRTVSGMTSETIGKEEKTPKHGLFAGINVDKNIGIAILGDESNKVAAAFLFPLDATTTAAFSNATVRSFGYAYNDGVPKYFAYDDDIFLTSDMSYVCGYAHYSTAYDLSISLAENHVTNISGIAILAVDRYLLTTDNMIIYDEYTYTDISSEPMDFIASGVTVSADKRYVYMIDTTNNLLRSYNVKNDKTAIEEISSMPLKVQNIDSLRIADSGQSILMFDSGKCDSITVLSVNR